MPTKGLTLEALGKAYQHGADWSQKGLDPPYELACWWELDDAFTGRHQGLLHAFGRSYWHGLVLPEWLGPDAE